MEFSLDNGNALYQIKSYKAGIVTVNKLAYGCPILLSPTELLAPWGPATLSELSEAHIQLLLSFKPQIVLIGTGVAMRFLNAKIFAPLMESNIGFEIMDTSAACRTYTLLMAEGRNVIAGLFT